MKKFILCMAVMVLGIVGAIAQTKNGGISEDMLGRIRQGYQGTPEQKAVMSQMGMIENKLRLPLVPARPVTCDKIRAELEALK